MAYVYRHIRLDKNEPFYIGVGNDNRNYRRAYDTVLRNSFWKNVMAKTKYEVEIIFDNLTSEEAYNKEIEFIKLYGRRNNDTGCLVNLTDGGEGIVGIKYSMHQRQKMKERVTGEKHPMFGKKHSPLTIKKMSDIKKGKKLSEETIIKLKNRPKILIPRSTRELSILACNKIVYQYGLDGSFIDKFKCISDAAIKYNGNVSCISAVCVGKRKSMYGFMWRYADSVKSTDNIQPIKSSPNDKRAVIQYTKEGSKIKEYISIRMAAKETSSSPTGIIGVCISRKKTHNNFKWAYK